MGAYELEMAKIQNGDTQIYHGWGKLGTEISEQERSQVVSLLERANHAISQRCGLPLADVALREGWG
jgi:hypothetical protein